MIPIALVTDKQFPLLDPDDHLLIAPLQSYGFDPHAEIWNNHKTDWSNYEGIIIRSPWDFYQHIDDFYQWLVRIESLHIPILNPPSIIRWSIDKSKYLAQLERKSIKIIPSVFVEKESKVNFTDILDLKKWDTAIIKPRYGGNGSDVMKVARAKIFWHKKALNSLLKKDSIIIQPFLPEFENGEYSFIFIGGKFSHAVIKKIKPRTFRLDSAIRIIPNKKQLDQAYKVYKEIDTPLLYARIDFINVQGALLLNELELSDPYLFFTQYPPAAEIFARTFKKFFRKELGGEF